MPNDALPDLVSDIQEEARHADLDDISDIGAAWSLFTVAVDHGDEIPLKVRAAVVQVIAYLCRRCDASAEGDGTSLDALIQFKRSEIAARKISADFMRRLSLRNTHHINEGEQQ